MLTDLVQFAGIGFLIALGAEALAVFVEQAAAARSPEEEPPRRGAGTKALMLLSALTPGMLLLHGYLSTAQAPPYLRVLAMGAPLAAMLGGALLGAILGAFAPSRAPHMRNAAPPLAIAALAAAAYAAAPSLIALVAAARNGGVVALP